MIRLVATCLAVCILGIISIETADAVTFTIDHSSLVVGGMINGGTLVPEPAPAGVAAGLTGTLDVIVDDLDSPTILQIVSGGMDVETNISDGPFRPGVGGNDSAAYGDFAFQASAGELIELAIRDLALDFSSGVLSVTGGEIFSAEQIQMEVSSGALDIRSLSMEGDRCDMTGLLAEPVDEEMGVLLKTGPGVYQLSFTYERTIDVSGLDDSIAAGSYLTLQGTIVAETESIPEPSALTMLCLGILGFLASVRRRDCRR